MVRDGTSSVCFPLPGWAGKGPQARAAAGGTLARSSICLPPHWCGRAYAEQSPSQQPTGVLLPGLAGATSMAPPHVPAFPKAQGLRLTWAAHAALVKFLNLPVLWLSGADCTLTGRLSRPDRLYFVPQDLSCAGFALSGVLLCWVFLPLLANARRCNLILQSAINKRRVVTRGRIQSLKLSCGP